MSASLLDAIHKTWVDDPSAANHERLFESVLTFARRRLQDDDESAEVCFDLVNGLRNFRGVVPFSSWLASICRRHRSEVVKREIEARRFVQIPDGDKDDWQDVTPPFRVPLADMDQDNRQAAEAVLTGSTIREAAQQVGLSEAALGMRLRRLGEKLSQTR